MKHLDAIGRELEVGDLIAMGNHYDGYITLSIITAFTGCGVRHVNLTYYYGRKEHDLKKRYEEFKDRGKAYEVNNYTSGYYWGAHADFGNRCLKLEPENFFDSVNLQYFNMILQFLGLGNTKNQKFEEINKL